MYTFKSQPLLFAKDKEEFDLFWSHVVRYYENEGYVIKREYEYYSFRKPPQNWFYGKQFDLKVIKEYDGYYVRFAVTQRRMTMLLLLFSLWLLFNLYGLKMKYLDLFLLYKILPGIIIGTLLVLWRIYLKFKALSDLFKKITKFYAQ